jgi:hypothetical protein
MRRRPRKKEIESVPRLVHLPAGDMGWQVLTSWYGPLGAWVLQHHLCLRQLLVYYNPFPLEFKDTRKKYEEPEIRMEKFCARCISRAVTTLSMIRIQHRHLFRLLGLGFIRIHCAEIRKLIIYGSFISSFLLPPLAWRNDGGWQATKQGGRSILSYYTKAEGRSQWIDRLHSSFKLLRSLSLVWLSINSLASEKGFGHVGRDYRGLEAK